MSARAAVAMAPSWASQIEGASPPGRLPDPVAVDEPITVLVAPPDLVTRITVEDVWERHGAGRLWVVATAGADRAGDALAWAAVGHAPELVRADGGPDEARQAVIVTALQLRAGDVLIVVSENAAAARGWVGQGMRWRASWEAPDGEYHAVRSP